MDLTDRETSYRALQTRDPRFDGKLFVGVTSTGIYCRPICPAHTPRFENCRFFPSAAAAQQEGFRPCLRCRPETAPDLAAWKGTSNTVSRALAILAQESVDVDRAGVDALAERLGMGGRQLRRLFKQHLGASPIAVMQTNRVLFAKQLIRETDLPMAEIAVAAGFGSVRRFHETFRHLFNRPPGALREKGLVPAAKAGEGSAGSEGVTLRLRYQPPYDWRAMVDFLAARTIEGIEVIDGDCYQRTVALEGFLGSVAIKCLPKEKSLSVTIRFPSVRFLPAIVARVRRAFDLSADIVTIGAHLSRDPFLARLVSERPGLRAPGAWDGFELAVRAILGQQITVSSARRLAARLVAHYGEPIGEDLGLHPRLTHVFPSPERLASADLTCLGMPGARRAALQALAVAASSDKHLFHPLASFEATIERLRAIRGIGDWTAQYIALRAHRETDAFPASDVGLLRGAVSIDGLRPTPQALLTRAESWRPWRAYAAQHLWAADAISHTEKNHA